MFIITTSGFHVFISLLALLHRNVSNICREREKFKLKKYVNCSPDKKTGMITGTQQIHYGRIKVDLQLHFDGNKHFYFQFVEREFNLQVVFGIINLCHFQPLLQAKVVI